VLGSAFWGLAVDATSVYWTVNPSLDYASGSVVEVPIGGGALTTLATNQYDPTGLAVDGTNVYWTTEYYTLMRVPIGGGTPELVTHGIGPGPVVLDHGFIYSFDGEDIVKASIEGNDWETLASSPSNIYPIGLAVDGTSVYWTEDHFVLKVGTDGSNATELLTRPEMPWAIAVDDTSIYWTEPEAGTLMKLTPK